MKEKDSEKKIESYLVKGTEKRGGWSLKFLPFMINGLPDRICLFPKGRIRFVETKSTGDKPRLIQTVVHTKLRKLGFKVDVISTIEGLEEFFKEIDSEKI